MWAFTIVPGAPALIRSDNTVRNGISTIGLQSLSFQSKGLLKHSTAQNFSLSFSPCLSLSLFFPVSLLPSIRLILHLFLFVTLIFSPVSVFLSLLISPPFLLCGGERRAWIPHTDCESPAAQQHYCRQIFSISSESLYLLFFLSLSRQEAAVKVYSVPLSFYLWPRSSVYISFI